MLISRDRIRDIMLQHGYKMRMQDDGTMELNPYVYAAAESLIQEVMLALEREVMQVQIVVSAAGG